MSKLPKTLPILGHDVSILNVALDEDYADADDVRREIRVDLVKHKKDSVDPEFSLFHEVLHIALGLSGVSEVLDDKHEEAVVKCLENGLWPLVQFRKDNGT